MFSVGEPVLPACAAARRHALTQPTPNPYEGSFNSNLPFRDCSESCIFLSRTNVYHSITNRETFVPVSRPTVRLPPCVDWPGIIRYFLRPRYIFAARETTSYIISCVSKSFVVSFFPSFFFFFCKMTHYVTAFCFFSIIRHITNITLL